MHGLHFSFGEVFNKGFSVYFRNFFSFMLMAVLCYSPLLVYALVMPEPRLDDLNKEEVLWALLKVTGVITIGSILCNQIVVSAVTYATVQELRGAHASIGDSLSVGIRRLLPALAVSIVAGLGMMLGFVALIIPGIMLMCAWYVAVPASVVERPGVFGAIGRSAELTRGHRWPILGIIILVMLMTGFANNLLDSIFVKTNEDGIPESWRAFMVFNVVSSAVFGALGAAMAAAAYVGLRNDKDGVGVDELARVFD